MILVNLSRSWRDVLSGRRRAMDVTLGEWAAIGDYALQRYADTLLGIHRGEVVSAYDVTGWSRDPITGRVTFQGVESQRWAHLIGTPNPGPRWVQGSARPVKYLDTAVLTEGNVVVEEAHEGHRAVVRGVTLMVNDRDKATLLLPLGRKVTVLASADQ